MAFETKGRLRAKNDQRSRQRTLTSAVRCAGIGLHSGDAVKMTLHPADPGFGIRFLRSDIPGARPVPATWDRVVDVNHCTVIGFDDGPRIGTIEHLMAAFAGCGVDNCLVELDAAEVPAMDGSAAPFVFLIEMAGTVEQAAPRKAIKILKPVMVQDGARLAALSPAAGFSVSFEIDFASAAVAHQECCFRVAPGSFKAEIARARTFGFMHELDYLRENGLALGGSLDNAVLVSGDRIVNEDGLRFPNEFVRHKVLDAIGDLALAGLPIIGHYHGVRAGHAFTNRLLRTVMADRRAWRIIDYPAPRQVEGGAVPDLARIAARHS